MCIIISVLLQNQISLQVSEVTVLIMTIFLTQRTVHVCACNVIMIVSPCLYAAKIIINFILN